MTAAAARVESRRGPSTRNRLRPDRTAAKGARRCHLSEASAKPLAGATIQQGKTRHGEKRQPSEQDQRAQVAVRHKMADRPEQETPQDRMAGHRGDGARGSVLAHGDRQRIGAGKTGQHEEDTDRCGNQRHLGLPAGRLPERDVVSGERCLEHPGEDEHRDQRIEPEIGAPAEHSDRARADRRNGRYGVKGEKSAERDQQVGHAKAIRGSGSAGINWSIIAFSAATWRRTHSKNPRSM